MALPLLPPDCPDILGIAGHVGNEQDRHVARQAVFLLRYRLRLSALVRSSNPSSA